MSKRDAELESARISARQAIIVAAITGVVSIVTTLIATGSIGRGDGGASGSGSSATSAPVLNAPNLFFVAKSIDASLTECMDKARDALGRGKFTGISSTEYFSWGYREDVIGGIWCHTDVRQVIFLSAGKDQAAVEEARSILDRSY
jgi:hypothetical protein